MGTKFFEKCLKRKVLPAKLHGDHTLPNFSSNSIAKKQLKKTK